MNNTKKCEYCSKKININYTICPFCGGRLSEAVESIQPVCPRCKVSLKTTVSNVSNGEEYHICPLCGGMWLDRVAFRRATSEYNVYRNENIKDEYKKEPIKDTVEYIPCVRCGKLMNRKNFSRISGVMIDECGRHGVWLDNSELKKIRHFIADGGLEKAQDREIERNRVKIEEVAADVEHTAFVQKILHFWNFKRWLFGG